MTENAPAMRSVLALLREQLAASHRVARRLAWSLQRAERLFPLDAVKMDALSDDEEERLDALLLRFNSLAAMIQDHVARAILAAEEEDVAERSRKDQRLLLEKLGALKPQLNFATIAELRNRVAHHYPDDKVRQAKILNETHARSSDLIEAYNDVLTYSNRKFFSNRLDILPVLLPTPNPASPDDSPSRTQ